VRPLKCASLRVACRLLLRRDMTEIATGPWTTAALAFTIACAALALRLARRRSDP
jgi:hypothetical protein